jgi:hypothetical protein
VCGQEVEMKDGILSISFKEIRDIQEREAAWKKAHPGPVLEVREVLAFPSRVQWTWHHCKCSVKGSSYEIEGKRFDTVEKALHWTIHLMGKNWFQFTNWRSVIARFYPECG